MVRSLYRREVQCVLLLMMAEAASPRRYLAHGLLLLPPRVAKASVQRSYQFQRQTMMYLSCLTFPSPSQTVGTRHRVASVVDLSS